MDVSEGQIWEVVGTYCGRPPGLEIGDRFLIGPLASFFTEFRSLIDTMDAVGDHRVFYPIIRWGQRLQIRSDDLRRCCILLSPAVEEHT